MGGGSPRFRRDLQATSVEAEGVQFIEVTDAQSGKSFRFYDFEHTVALALDGRPLDAVAADLKQNSELELTPDQLASFADQLEALGFLENGENGKSAAVADSAGEGFFPPLTANETGAFDRPAIIGGPEQLDDDEVTPAPEPLPVPGMTPPIAQASAPAIEPEPEPQPQLELEPEPPPLVEAAPPAPPSPPSQPFPMSATPPPAPRFQPLRSPPSDPVPAPFPSADLGPPPVLGPSPSALGPSPSAFPPSPSSLGPSPPALRPRNGAHAAGEIETAPVRPTMPPPPPSPSPEPVREPLRLVPKPRPVPVPVLEPPGPLPTEVEPDPAAPELQEEPAPEGEEQPVVLNTGAPIFPDSPAEDEPVQRLEVSMTRRFITPDRSRASRSSRKALLAYGALGLAAAAVVVMTVMRFLASDEPPPVSVQVVVPSPTSVYRWWDKTATVQQAGGAPLAFASDGKVAEVVPAGTKFAAGDTLAMLERGKSFRSAINYNKSRLAYYEQMRETMTQQDNKRGLRNAELKVAEKKLRVAEAQESFARYAIVAAQPGEVTEALVTKGASVKAGEAALQLKSSGIRAVFELPRADADKARQLGFCRAEVDGKPLECSLAAEGGDETHVPIELPNDASLVNKSVRLARDRLDAVFAVPLSALVRVGESDRLYVVGPDNRAEMRVVAVADRGATGATVTQGLDVGDRVIVDPAGLKQDTRVLVNPPAR
jgi:multidrug efflux pump subunit AcrA (membrane-fusion protein)